MKKLLFIALLLMITSAVFAQSVEIYIGNANSGVGNRANPVTYYWEASLTQNIYYADEINLIGADITKLTWRFQGAGDIPANQNVSIWLANVPTSVETFASGTDWVPFDQFTSVWNAQPIPGVGTSGMHDVTVVLPTPFTYTGGNLVVMARKHNHGAYFGQNNMFLATTEPNRTLLVAEDDVEFDPSTDYPTGTLGTSFANIIVTFDNIQFADHDLKIAGFSGPVIVPSSRNFAIKVENNGTNNIAANAYTIEIRRGDTDALVHTITETPAMVTLASAIIEWDGAEIDALGNGTYPLVAKGVYAPDTVPANNISNTLNVTVQLGTLSAAIGLDTGQMYRDAPFTYYWLNGVNQVIYHADEINAPGNTIEKISWKMNSAGNVPNSYPVSVYLANVENPELYFANSTAWVPFDQFTLVWDSMPLPDVENAGVKYVTIELAEPFIYTGGSLVVMSHKHMTTSYFDNNTYAISLPEIETTGGRMLISYSDSVNYDLTALPAATNNYRNYSDIVLYLGAPLTEPRLSVSPSNDQNFGVVSTVDSASRSFTIKNIGPGTLNVSSIALGGGNSFAFATPPTAQTLTGDVTYQFTVVFSPTTEGDFNDVLTIIHDAEGSPFTLNLSGTGIGNMIMPTPGNPYVQTFPVMPTATNESMDVYNFWRRYTGDWGAMAIVPLTTVWNSYTQWAILNFGNLTTPPSGLGASYNLYSNQKFWLTTPTIVIPEGQTVILEMDMAFTGYSTSTAPATVHPDAGFYIFVSEDGGETYPQANIVRGWNGTPTSPDYLGNIPTAVNGNQTFFIPLTGYSGNIKVGFFGRSEVTGTDSRIHLDNITFTVDAAAHDLRVTSFSGPDTYPSALPFNVGVMNGGNTTIAANAYSIAIYRVVDGGTDTILHTITATPALTFGQTATIPWDGTGLSTLEAGNYQFYAVGVYAADEVPGNNTSGTIDVTILDDSTVSIGGQNNYQSTTLPINYYYLSSINQSLYYGSEINKPNGGILETISLNMTRTGAIPANIPVTIWAANKPTDFDRFPLEGGVGTLDSYVPFNEFTCIWDATPIPGVDTAGAGWITIDLQNPIFYEGENLVIMYYRHYSANYYSNQTFLNSTPDAPYDEAIRRSVGIYADDNFGPPSAAGYPGITYAFVNYTDIRLGFVPSPNAPTFYLSPALANQNYGNVPVESGGYTRTYTLRNIGQTGTVSVSNIALQTGTAFTRSNITLPVTLSPGVPVTFTVSFNPPAVQTYNDVLTATHNAGAPVVINLSGTGTPVLPPRNLTYTRVNYDLTLNWEVPNRSISNGIYLTECYDTSEFFEKEEADRDNTDLTRRSLGSGYIPPVINPPSRALQGYNVYRDNVLISSTTPISATTFSDTVPQDGTYLYTIKAVYDIGESEGLSMSIRVIWGEVTVFEEDFSVYADFMPPAGDLYIDDEAVGWGRFTGHLDNPTEFIELPNSSTWIIWPLFDTGPVAANFWLYGQTGNKVDGWKEWATSPTFHISPQDLWYSLIEIEIGVGTYGTSSNPQHATFSLIISDDGGATFSENNLLRTWDYAELSAIRTSGGLETFEIEVPDYYSGDCQIAFFAQIPDGSTANFDFYVPRVKVVSYTFVSDDDDLIDLKTSLKNNYPNPFNPSTTISFDVAKEGRVAIDIFNIKGQKVKTLTNDIFGIGNHRVVWNGLDEMGNATASGVYFYRMTTDGFSETKKMILMK